MKEVKRSALVAQPASRMFALISDVDSYPSFVPWCTHVRVESRTEREIVAALGVKRGLLHMEFTTRTELDPDKRVEIHLVKGPFRSLHGTWLLTPIADTMGCRVELTMRFEFSNALSAMVLDPIFEDTAVSLVNAFVARARALGPPPAVSTAP